MLNIILIGFGVVRVCLKQSESSAFAVDCCVEIAGVIAGLFGEDIREIQVTLPEPCFKLDFVAREQCSVSRNSERGRGDGGSREGIQAIQVHIVWVQGYRRAKAQRSASK